MTMNFNIDPYYDDYDETKGFHRILFNPGQPVQARELTQIQTILQKQVSRFGDSIYREGSVVSGGEHFLDDSVFYIKLQASAVDLSLIEGKYIKETSDSFGTRVGLVKKYTAATTTDPATIHVSIVSGKSVPFVDNTQLDVYSDISDTASLYSVTSASTSASGNGLLFHVNQGVFYTNKAFVFCPAQTVVVSKYNRQGSAVIGLTIVESIISADVDDTLLDPAFGSYNYAAPGADRYMISLLLDTKPYSETTQSNENFIELIHVKEGVLLSDQRLPIYSNIGDTMARRTYDESGDYIVTPFIPKITQDQNDALVGSILSIQSDTEATLSTDAILAFTGLRLKRERSSVGFNLTGTISVSSEHPNKLLGVGTNFTSELIVNDTIKTGADSNLILEISAGKAYVRGYELEFNGQSNLILNKSRATGTETEKEINTYYGNYTLVSSVSGSLPNVNAAATVDVHNSTTPTALTKIGTVQITGLDWQSGSGSSVIFYAQLKSLALTSGTFDTIRSFATSSDSYSTIAFQANIDSSAIVDSKAQLYDANYDSLLFTIPPYNVKSLSSIEYYYKKKWSTVTVTNGVATISTDTSHDRFVPVSSSSQYKENFTAIVTAKTSGTFTNGQYIPLDLSSRSVTVTAVSGSPGQAVLNFNDSTFNGSVDIIANVRTSDDSRRVKTLVSGFVKSVTVTNTKISLDKSDVYALKNVYELTSGQSYIGAWSSSTTYALDNVVTLSGIAYASLGNNTNKSPDTNPSNWSVITDAVKYYTFDNGQTNSSYDYGSITRISPVSSSITALVIFDYFTHSGAGYISADSYPLDYSDIPTFNDAKGNTINLKDSIDFRPRRVDDSVTVSYQTFTMPKLSNNVIASVEYYLRKIDKVILTREGKFKVIEGTPSLFKPIAPAALDDSMTLYILTYAAYTSTEKDVSIQVIPNRRYTMRDIGAFDTRIRNVEYYTALSLVESQISNQSFSDSTGLPLFKNGFLVDTFKGHDVGDVSNPEYNCAVDTQKKELRPPIDIRNTYFSYVSPASGTDPLTVVANNSGIVTLPYTDANFINQSVASSAISVNPFDVVVFSGNMKITPESDVWVNINKAPDVTENVDGVNDNYDKFQSLGTTWNSWETVWGGIEKETGTTEVVENGYKVTKSTFDVFENRKYAGVETLQAPPASVLFTNTKTIDKSVIPYARAKNINFTVTGLAPNVPLYLYIDGKHMSNYLFSASSNSNLTIDEGTYIAKPSVFTDQSGSAMGVIHFPEGFTSGKHTLALCDNATDPTLATCWSEVPYLSEGTLQTDQTTIVSTRGGNQVTRNVQKTELFKVRTETRVISKIPVYSAPNANYALNVDKPVVRENNTVTFTLTANNVPVGRSYTATLSGTVVDADLDGTTLGSKTLTTTGTLASNTATLPIKIKQDSLNESDETLTLTVDIPADTNHPEWGGPLTLTATTTVTNETNPSYQISAPSAVNEGGTIGITVSSSNLTTSKTITYVVTGTCTEYTGSSTGSITLQSSNGYSQSLSYPIASNAVATGTEETFIVTFTMPDGSTMVKTVRVLDVAVTPPTTTFILNGPTSFNDKEDAAYTLTTTNVSNGTVITCDIIFTPATGATDNGYTWAPKLSDGTYGTTVTKSTSFTINSNTGGFKLRNLSPVSTNGSGTYSITLRSSTYNWGYLQDVKLNAPAPVVVTITPAVAEPVVVSKIGVVPAKIGDFVDSNYTIAEAVAEFKDKSAQPSNNSSEPMIVGYTSKGRTDSELLAIGAAIKQDYIDLVNRYPDIAGWITWMNYVCDAMSTKTTSFTSPVMTQDPTHTYLGRPTLDTVGINAGTAYRSIYLYAGVTYAVHNESDDTAKISLFADIKYAISGINSIFDSTSTYNNVSHSTFQVSITGTYYLRIYTANDDKNHKGTPWGVNLAVFKKGTAIDPRTNVASHNSSFCGPYVTWDMIWWHNLHLAAETFTLSSSTPSNQTQALAAVRTEIQKATAGESRSDKLITCTTDPLAQSFFVDSAKYPNGVFISKFDLFFKQKDVKLPVWAEIRPNVNGYPSSDTKMPLSHVSINPGDVQVSSDGSLPTTFIMDAPVFLKPGEYSIVTGSNSSKYYAFVSEMGQKQIGTNAIISKQPYVGSLFKSQNASTWTATQEQDLMFKLYNCSFVTSGSFTAEYTNDYDTSDFTSFEFDTIKISSTEIDFGEKTDISYQLANTASSTGSTLETYSVIDANKNLNLSTRKKINSVDDTKLKITLKSNDKYISPVIDNERLSAFLVQNMISSSSSLTVPEETPYGGNAYAKYVSRSLTLAEGFDATGLRIILDVNRPQGTSIKVYAKVLSAEDSDNFEYKEYQEIPLVSKPQYYSNGTEDFIIDEYKNDAITYFGKAGKFTTFRTFAIKIVMFSDDPVNVPRIKNLRAIATS